MLRNGERPESSITVRRIGHLAKLALPRERDRIVFRAGKVNLVEAAEARARASRSGRPTFSKRAVCAAD